MIDAKKQLFEIFDFWKYKIDNNLCTPEEIDSVTKLLMENMELNASIKDFAEFYRVSESNVRATISRKVFAKPKRMVLYPFQALAKVVTDKWHNNR